ncbi:MAG: class I SAM-dependent methyltransferase [Deltaproteobacteria bacterium]|nr:class I SAM-dependent methyltransferase [Deltaproteobacteria bacterium]
MTPTMMPKLQLDGVASTAIMTLRARAEEHRRRDRLFEDPWAETWLPCFEWPRSLDAWYGRYTQGFLAYRAYEIDQIALDFLDQIPNSEGTSAQIVELGAGLSSRGPRLIGAVTARAPLEAQDQSETASSAPTRRHLTFVDLDLPAIIDARRRLGVYTPAAEDTRESASSALPTHSGTDAHPYTQVAVECSVTDLAWIEHPALDPEVPTIFIAEGLFYYLPETDVRRILDALRDRFPNTAIVFDIIGMLEFRGARRFSTRAGAPIQWMLPPPFESVYPRFRLEPLPGWPPSRLLDRVLELCWSRFGRTPALLSRALANISVLRAQRSGIVAARLESRSTTS